MNARDPRRRHNPTGKTNELCGHRKIFSNSSRKFARHSAAPAKRDDGGKKKTLLKPETRLTRGGDVTGFTSGIEPFQMGGGPLCFTTEKINRFYYHKRQSMEEE